MKLYKLNQGSTFENLKHFIYLTNEYGVPSGEFVDDFIVQFGKVILNGNFTITKNQIKQLNELWISIVKDCTHNNVEYRENYSSLFYIILSTKALDKIKEGWEQSEWNQLTEQDRLELLKQFIIDFDKYIQDGIDMADYLYFENTPELIRKDKNGEEYIKIHMNESDRGLCTARLYRNNRTVIEIGSNIGNIEPSALDRPTVYNQIINGRRGHVENNKVIVEITSKSPSGAGVIYRGFTCNGWVAWYNEHNELIDNYRERSNVYMINTGYTEQPKQVDKPKITVQDANAARIQALLGEDYEQEQTEIEHKEPIQHYILKAEYREFCNESLINSVIFKGNEKIGTIASNTELNIDGEIIDIGEYIVKNNIGDPRGLRIAHAWFNKIYEKM